MLADADADGAHIATLICALFVRHFRALVDGGHLYIAQTPLYRIDHGREVYYAADDADLRRRLATITSKAPNAKPTVIRFKGLGEMNPSQLRETTLDPAHRKLVKLVVNDGEQMDVLFNNLLARQNSAWRRSWLEVKGDSFQLQD